MRRVVRHSQDMLQAMARVRNFLLGKRRQPRVRAEPLERLFQVAGEATQFALGVVVLGGHRGSTRRAGGKDLLQLLGQSRGREGLDDIAVHAGFGCLDDLLPLGLRCQHQHRQTA